MKTSILLILTMAIFWGCQSQNESSDKVTEILNQEAQEPDDNAQEKLVDIELTEEQQEIVDLIEGGEEAIIEEVTEQITEIVTEEIYYFNVENGLCQNKNGNVGLNKSLDALPSGECLDLTNQMISGDFDITALIAPYGLDLSGATILQELTAEFLLRYEIVIDPNTTFDLEDQLKQELANRLLEQLGVHQEKIQETKDKIIKGLNKLKKTVADLEEVVAKGEYERGNFVFELNPEQIEKLQKEINRVNAQIDMAIEKVSQFELKLDYLNRILKK